MYLIQRIDDGAFVAVEGSKSSYTFDIRRARTYHTHTQAAANCCGNEHPVHIDRVLPTPTH